MLMVLNLRPQVSNFHSNCEDLLVEYRLGIAPCKARKCARIQGSKKASQLCQSVGYLTRAAL